MKSHQLFRIVGYLEGLSFLLLLFVGVPLKYLSGDPRIVKAVGMPHGILFLLYVFLAYELANKESWTRTKLWTAFAASLLPFGTLVFDWKHSRRN